MASKFGAIGEPNAKARPRDHALHDSVAYARSLCIIDDFGACFLYSGHSWIHDGRVPAQPACHVLAHRLLSSHGVNSAHVAKMVRRRPTGGRPVIRTRSR